MKAVEIAKICHEANKAYCEKDSIFLSLVRTLE